MLLIGVVFTVLASYEIKMNDRLALNITQFLIQTQGLVTIDCIGHIHYQAVNGIKIWQWEYSPLTLHFNGTFSISMGQSKKIKHGTKFGIAAMAS